MISMTCCSYLSRGEVEKSSKRNFNGYVESVHWWVRERCKFSHLFLQDIFQTCKFSFKENVLESDLLLNFVYRLNELLIKVISFFLHLKNIQKKSEGQNINMKMINKFEICRCSMQNTSANFDENCH